MPIFYRYFPSPVGKLLLLANAEGLLGIQFEAEQATISLADFQPADNHCPAWGIFTQTENALTRYFAGEKMDFAALDFLAPKGTPFQQAVWQKLREIPFGETASYGEIAAALGKPQAMRAVGGAVGRNPIVIFIPCHRVLSKTQALTGFGGGLPAKRHLLALEHIAYQDSGTEYVRPKTKHWGG